MEGKMFRYKCIYKCERCGAIYFGEEIRADSELNLSNIIINKESNYVAVISKDYEYVELSPLEFVSHTCKQQDGIVTGVGMAKFIGINSIEESQ